MQVISYFGAVRATLSNPPVLCVLYCGQIDLIIFPYKNKKGEVIVNPLWIPFQTFEEEAPFFQVWCAS